MGRLNNYRGQAQTFKFCYMAKPLKLYSIHSRLSEYMGQKMTLGKTGHVGDVYILMESP